MDRPIAEIPVAGLCGRHCIASEEAEILHREILLALQTGRAARLDFAGVETLASSFLTVAIGRLCESVPGEVLGPSLRWTGLDAADERVLRLIIRNATEYYGQGPKERRVHRQILSDLA